MSYIYYPAPPDGLEPDPLNPGYWRHVARPGYYYLPDGTQVRLPGPGIGGDDEIPYEPNNDVPINYIELKTTDLSNAVISEVGTLPLVYGKQLIQGQTIGFKDGLVAGIGNFGVFIVAVSVGPIQSVNQIYINDSVIPWVSPSDPSYGTFPYSADIYLGSYSQGPHWLVGKLPGVAFVEVRIWGIYGRPWNANLPAEIKFQFEVDGLIVPNMSNTPVYSKNPALIIRDVLTDTEHGAGEALSKIDTTSFTDAYTYYNTADATYPDGFKFTLNGVFPSQQPLQVILDAMALAANCRVYQADGVWKIRVAPVVGAVAHAFDTDTDCSNLQYSSLQGLDHPTRVTIKYRNAAKRFQDDLVVVEDPLIALGQIPIVPGDRDGLQTTCITQEKQAHAVAINLFNQASLAGRVSFETTTIGVNLNVGDLITLVTSDGMAPPNNQFLIQTLTRNSNGFYSIAAQQYVTGMFSDKAITSDIAVSTNLTNPFDDVPDIIPDGGSPLYQTVYKESTGTQTVNNAYAGVYFTLPVYQFANRLIVRCAVGSSAWSQTWDDMVATERIISINGNAPINQSTGHSTLIADALSVGTETWVYDGNTAVETSHTKDFQASRIIVKLENTYGIQSVGATIDNVALYDVVTNKDTSPPPPAAVRHHLTDSSLAFDAPRNYTPAGPYGSGSWTILSGTPVGGTSTINNGVTTATAVTVTSGAIELKLDLGSAIAIGRFDVWMNKSLTQIYKGGDFHIQYSDDGVTWTPNSAHDAQTSSAGWGKTVPYEVAVAGGIYEIDVDIPTSIGAHRYWKIYVSVAAAIGALNITEVQANTYTLYGGGAGETIDHYEIRSWSGGSFDPLWEDNLNGYERPSENTPVFITTAIIPTDASPLTPVDFSPLYSSFGDPYSGIHYTFRCAVSTFGVISSSVQAPGALRINVAPIAPPKGDSGVKGDSGPAGSPGPVGDTGIVGATGPKGDTGIKGSTGVTGASGVAGDTGIKGSTGVTGAAGSTGVTGPRGDTGTQGIQGAQGPQGASGPFGDTGPQGGAGATGPPGSDANVTYSNVINAISSRLRNIGPNALITTYGGGSDYLTITSPAAVGPGFSPQDGYMTSADKGKLDGIQAGATDANGAISPTSIACSGNITAQGNITAYYSDERLKENVHVISDALNKVNLLSGVTFNSNDLAASFGYTDKREQVGVIAQQVQEVLPQVIFPAPFDTDKDGNSKSGENYMTVQYEKIVPLLIEAIKELTAKVRDMEEQFKHRNGFGYNGNGNGNGAH